MASLSYHETLKIFVAAVMAFSVAAADQDCSNLTSVKGMCNMTSFPDLCYNSLVPKIGSNAKPQVIYKQSAEVALAEVSKASLDFAVNGKLEQLVKDKMPNNRLALSALQSCRIFFSLALDNINNSLSSTELTSPETRDNIRTWLSAACADLQTCEDGFDDLSDEIRNIVTEKLKNSTEYTENSLAIITEIDRCASSTMEANKNCYTGQELSRYTGDHGPNCFSSKGRKLLQAANPNTVNSDLVLAHGASGN
ncbi:hypothetical protein Pfo_021069 [Paulownia fortunei]|nr:hypothetical protein Pfo_021069 [Paulownia fortunei]